MLNETYRRMLEHKSVIRETAAYGHKRAAEIGYENVFDYSLGNPSVPCPPAFTAAMQDLLANEDPVALHGYCPNQGDPGFRAAAAAHLHKTFGLPYESKHIFPATGAAGAIAHALRAVTAPGDEVLTFAPYFVEYGFYVANHGGTLATVPSRKETFAPDVEALEKAMSPKTRAVLINSPHNPTGAIYTLEELKELVALLERKTQEYNHPVWLISDEPYRFLAYDGAEVPSVLPLYPYAVCVSSFSKNLSLPGERVGYIALSPLLENRTELMAALTITNRILGYVNAPIIGQHIMAAALGASVDVDIYTRRRNAMAEVLRETGYEFNMPRGSFYFFPKSPIEDDKAFIEVLTSKCVLGVPGSGFGCPGYFRLAFCVDESVIRRAKDGFAAAREHFA